MEEIPFELNYFIIIMTLELMLLLYYSGLDKYYIVNVNGE